MSEGTAPRAHKASISIGLILADHVRTAPGHLAFISSEARPLSYLGLFRDIERLRDGVGAAGLGPAVRIAVSLPCGLQAALAIVAIACCAVAVPLNPTSTLADVSISLISQYLKRTIGMIQLVFRPCAI